MAAFPGSDHRSTRRAVSDPDEGSDQEHRRDLLDGAVAPAVARVRALVDGGLVGWARRRVAGPDGVDPDPRSA
jgi:hypothetical protein